MRRLLLLVLCCAASADWNEVHERFRTDYRKADSAKARRDAIRAMARADVQQAAVVLFTLWDELDSEATRLRKDLVAGRGQLAELQRKKRASRRNDERQRIINQILALEAKDVFRDRRLSGIDIEKYAVLSGLRRMKGADVLAWMEIDGLRRARSPVLLGTVATLVASRKPDRLLPEVTTASKPDRLIPLLQALAHEKAKAPSDVTPLVAQLAHPDWAVRAAAAHALARAAKPAGVGPLVAALAREKARSRAQLELTRALSRLTGKKIGPYPDLWKRWWADHKTAVEAGKTKLGEGENKVATKREQGTFYGIPQDVDRIIYVFDKSGSMIVSMEHPRWEGKAPVPAYDDEDSRFDAAVRELLRATKRLRRGSSYAVLLYSDRPRKLHGKLVPATPDEHTKLGNALAREGPEGSTNIYEALDIALKMANVHSQLTRGEQQADAIFLVSDGSPTNPKGESEDPERTLQAVREWNAAKRIAIHCIGIGAGHNSSFLKQLAEDNGGQYYAVLPKKKSKK